MKKVYISGKITGCTDFREHFKRIEDRLIEEGNVCMNPAVLGEGFPWEVYMPICYAMIDACDTIYMLNNWQDSRGARLEYDYAKEHGLEIIFEDEVLQMSHELSDKKQNKVDETRKILEDKGIIYKEMQYGQFQVDKANFWATTEKWHDPVRREKGTGINSFLVHLKKIILFRY